MTGSEKESKTLPLKLVQLPLKGMSTFYKDERTGQEFRIEGMGDGRFRIHTPKRQRSAK